jgi:hypothetical protein
MLNGFFWNGELRDLVIEYSGKEITYRHPKTGSDQLARFIRPVQINVGRFNSPYDAVTEHLHEEVAPVGDCNGAHVELLLTETGRLVGFADSMLLRWGEESAHWRLSASSLLHGFEAVVIGQVK